MNFESMYPSYNKLFGGNGHMTFRLSLKKEGLLIIVMHGTKTKSH